MGAEELFPFQNTLRRLGPPHGSAEFPAHAILQSVSVAFVAPFSIESPQSVLMRNTRSTRFSGVWDGKKSRSALTALIL